MSTQSILSKMFSTNQFTNAFNQYANTDYVVNSNNRMKYAYVGSDYIRCTENEFGVKYVGERKCFDDTPFVCPFKDTIVSNSSN